MHKNKEKDPPDPLKNWRNKCLGLSLAQGTRTRDQQNQQVHFQASICVMAISVAHTGIE